MVLQIGKLIDDVLVAKFITNNTLKEFKDLVGEGDYVDITGVDIQEGDKFVNGDVIHCEGDSLSTESVKALYLMLGSACNMSCRHCTQTPIKCNVAYPNIELSKDVLDFIVNWDKMAVEGYIFGAANLYFIGLR